jgi:predicted house-cleaning noncanonical NTP pyrophosphatase (MazG superfamily)
MIRFYYGEDGNGKLVRDKLDEVIRAERHIVKTRKLKPEELSEEILKKTPEEISELLTAFKSGDTKEEKEELADLLTLIDSYIETRDFDIAEIEKIKQAKKRKKGAFSEGTFIEYVDLNPEGDDYEFWCAHFRKNADRYKEGRK